MTVFASVIGCSGAIAQPIAVQVNTGAVQQFATSSPIVLNVGELPAGTTTIRVWDTTRDGFGLPVNDIPLLVVRGSDADNNATLRVLLRAQAGFPDLPLTPFVDVDMAAVNFAGLVIENPANPNDDSLRRRTRFAGGVTGSITGDITVGQVQRIQAGLTGQSVGAIDANITAISPNATFGFNTIEYVGAAARISGDIVATRPQTGYTPGTIGTYATIGRVYVGGSDASLYSADIGLVGDVRAERGQIREVYVESKIGAYDNTLTSGVNEEIVSNIVAADGILRVVAHPESDVVADTTMRNGAFRTNIIANLKTQQGWVPASNLVASQDAVINLIATRGSIVGDISANVLTYVPGGAESQRAGIYAGRSSNSSDPFGGSILGTVTIKHAVLDADIVAKTRLTSVIVGRQLRGSIVAYGGFVEFLDGTSTCPGDPFLPFVEVGFADPVADNLPNWVVALNAGMVGSNDYLFDPRGIPTSATPQTLNQWLQLGICTECAGTGSKDSIIFTPVAGTVRLRSMSVIAESVRTLQSVSRLNAPRVEVDLGRLLDVGDMRCGVVWSYRKPPETPSPDPALDPRKGWPSRWHRIDAACIGANSVIWAQTVPLIGCALPETNGTFVEGNVMGTISQWSFQSNDRIVIGEGLIGFDETDCDCTTQRAAELPCVAESASRTSTVPGTVISPSDGTPRSASRLLDTALQEPFDRGLITLPRRFDPDGLPGTVTFAGQVIIHAKHSGLDWDVSKWTGRVFIGDLNFGIPETAADYDPSTPRFIQPDLRGPDYARKPLPECYDTSAVNFGTDFGTGAIGLVPFAIHRMASEIEAQGTDCLLPGMPDAPIRTRFNRPDSTCPDESFCDGVDSDNRFVDILFYGPVKFAPVYGTQAVVPQPLRLWLLNPNASSNPCTSLIADGTQAYSKQIIESGRRLQISGTQGFVFPAGTYRLGVWESGIAEQALRCDSLLTTEIVRPRNFNQSSDVEFFSVKYACALDPCESSTDPSCNLDPYFGCDSVDFNNDTSLFDPTDVDAFFSVFSEGPCIPATALCNDVDFNNDGSSFDPCDLDAFLVVFSEGPCTLCGD